MASKPVPSSPAKCMAIRQVTPSITTLSLPFARFGRVKIGGRGTLARLPSGSLVIFSPVALTPDVKSRVSEMGKLKYIAALDVEHHLFVGPWHKEYPEATVIAPEGLKEKREAMPEMEKVRWDVIFKAKGCSERLEGDKVVEKDGFAVDEEFDREFDRTYIPSHTNKEIVFNFRHEKTLIQADLMFNLPAIEQYSKSGEDPHTGWPTKLFTKLNGTGGGQINWQRRFIWHISSSGDRPGFGRSVRDIQEWDFNRIIPCHGDIIETGGKEVFRDLFSWYKKEKGA